MKSRKTWAILLAAALLLAASCIAAIFATDGTPGSASDPVVSKSYMDAQIAILQTQIDDLKASGGTGTPSQSAASVFEVVKVDAGKKLIGGASTEIILRSGNATAIAGASGGVSDLTGGVDLSTGTDVSKNHLLVIPVDDGRGIRCTSTCYVMIKGEYTLK
ncbi:MAG: hypothetical protein II474_05585 [Firmicutes bacterium]|nr:hypothetical protein [Bacillota bacterium]